MTVALNEKKAFLTWEESVVVFQTDARQGELYENGSGIALDISLASYWYRLAAQQGDPIAKDHSQRLAQRNT